MNFRTLIYKLSNLNVLILEPLYTNFRNLMYEFLNLNEQTFEPLCMNFRTFGTLQSIYMFECLYIKVLKFIL